MALLYVPHYGKLNFTRHGVLTVANSRARDVAPYQGEVLGYGGFLQTVGTVAGQTAIQIRNETKTPDLDYFIVLPYFTLTGGGKVEGGTLIASPTFNAGDVFWLDVDAISTAPADLSFWLTCRFFVSQEV